MRCCTYGSKVQQTVMAAYLADRLEKAIEMIIVCLTCGQVHVCAESRPGGPTCEETAPKHRCRFCGLEWTVAARPTVGVKHQPGQFDE